MKKIIFAAAMVVAGSIAFAQKNDGALLTKNGHAILPEAGDYGLSVDASPILKYMGNMFNTSTNNAPTFGSGSYTIRGKYFLSEKIAIRASLVLNLASSTQKYTIGDDAAITAGDANARTFDSYTQSGTNIGLNFGYEFRRGYRRLQGFYGAEIGIAISSGKDAYKYGNSFSSTNTNPTTHNFNGNYYGGTRTLKSTNGVGFGGVVSGFVGVEYFFAPKMSFGGELSLGLSAETVGAGKTTTEKWDNSSVVETTLKSYNKAGGDISFAVAPQGGIFLNFYF
ncbi:MAG: hypothetical protein LBH06_05415 [Rikenellaceae bacterium]|jgi:hypothetical protein|nr:hypothetical protein [Rikenellaceae bacterium]